MAEVVPIQTSSDPRVDDFRDLTRADRRPDRPGGRGLVIAEGVVVVRRLLASPYPIRAVLGVQRRVEELAADLADVDVPVYVTDAGTMAHVVGFHLNRGVLAVAGRAPVLGAGEVAAGSSTLAVLEGVGDHENLGALFRNVAALGIGGVLLGAGCSDPLYRRSVRVSMGTVLRVPFAPLPPSPGGLALLRQYGFHLAALTPAPESTELAKFAARGHERVALLLGSEGHGLSGETVAAADVAVRIPMVDGVDSLNIATAGAVAFYELARQAREPAARAGGGRLP